MYQGLLVMMPTPITENPLVLREYLEPQYRDRIGLVIDRLAINGRESLILIRQRVK